MAAKKKADTKSKDRKLKDSKSKDDAGGNGGQGKGGKGPSEQKYVNVKGAQSIIVRHILCDKFTKKEEALAKLRAGIPWTVVAQEYATERARTGGALGEKRKGQLEAEFEKVAFALPAYKGDKETTDYPYGEAKTQYGYHIIRVDTRK